jgi:hypothetical protein
MERPQRRVEVLTVANLKTKEVGQQFMDIIQETGLGVSLKALKAMASLHVLPIVEEPILHMEECLK